MHSTLVCAYFCRTVKTQLNICNVFAYMYVSSAKYVHIHKTMCICTMCMCTYIVIEVGVEVEDVVDDDIYMSRALFYKQKFQWGFYILTPHIFAL